MRDGGIRTHEGSLESLEAEASRDRNAEERQLQVTALEMRLASIAARMSAPRKGDRPEALSAEYDAVAAELRELKRV